MQSGILVNFITEWMNELKDHFIFSLIRLISPSVYCLFRSFVHYFYVLIVPSSSWLTDVQYISPILQIQFSCSVVSDSLRPHEPQHAQASLSITNSWSPFKPMSIESMMPSNHLILCHPLLLLPSIFPSIRVFSNESALHIRWPKYWNFSFSISPSNEHPGLISFRMDWLDLLAVQGTQVSSPTPQFKSINSLVLSFLYCPTLTSTHDHWKNHSLD